MKEQTLSLIHIWHNAQLASMLGCAVGLRAVADSLAGSVCLLAAPAEEYVEIGWRAGRYMKSGRLSREIVEAMIDHIYVGLSLIHIWCCGVRA